MPEGKVKDPEGHQSTSYDFGYFERKEMEWPEEDASKPKKMKKVIPFLNRPFPGSQDRIFTRPGGPYRAIYPREAAIYLEKDEHGNLLPEKVRLGTIGIAFFEPPAE